MTTKTILLVEDDDDSRIIYGTVLRHAGYGVVEAPNGEVALRVARERAPDCIVMDAGLPVLDGWRATWLIKRDPATAGIPVLILTVHGQTEDVERAREAGCDAYVVKPMEPADLIQTIQEMLGP